MKKKLIITLVLLVLVGAFFSYHQYKQTKADEFKTYYNEVFAPTLGKEAAKISDTNKKTQELLEQDKKQEIANHVKEETLPLTEKSLERFKDVEPDNNEIKKLNQMTIHGEKKRKKVIEQVILFLEDKQSQAAIDSVEKDFNQHFQKVKDYSEELINKYGLEKDPDDKVGKLEKVK